MKVFTFLAGFALILISTLGVFTAPIDYDEVEHAHEIWLISKGLIPMVDFLAYYPPFFWYLLSPTLSFIGENLKFLYFLRFFSLLGHILFIVTLLRFSNELTGKRSSLDIFLPLLLLMTLEPAIKFHSQFRIDGWVQFMLFLSLLLFQKKFPSKPLSKYLLFGFLISSSMLLHPRMVLFSFIFILALLVLHKEDPIQIRILGLFCGFLGSMVTGIFTLWILKIPISEFFDLIFLYHWILNDLSMEKGVLVSRILEFPVLAIYLCLCFLAWFSLLIQKKIKPQPFQPAFILFLCLQLYLVNVPYIQFYVPLLIISLIFSPYLLDVMEKFTKIRRNHAYISLFIIFMISLPNFYSDRMDSLTDLKKDKSIINMLLQETKPNDYVVAFPPLHPIFRYDSFYGWHQSISGSEATTEVVMQKMPNYKSKFQKEAYLKELNINPPDLISFDFIPSKYYYPGQNEALMSFLNQDSHDYEKKKLNGLTIYSKR